MNDISVDVGSGVTKVRTESMRAHFPSLSGFPNASGQDVEASEGASVRFNGNTYVTGERAYTLVDPEKLVNTRDDQWFMTDAYLSLLYAALSLALPDGYNGRISLCTGLPQATFMDQKEALAKRLSKTHKFEVNGVKYCVFLRPSDIRIVPQAMGLFLSRLDLDRTLQTEKVGVIDVGTYTSDWMMVDRCKALHWAADGAPIGVAKVVEGIRTYLRDEHNNPCSYAAASEAVRSGKIRCGNRTINLSEHIRAIAFTCTEQLIPLLQAKWGASWDHAKDSKVIIGGGGAAVFAPAIRASLAHATVIEDDEPIYSIVDGYYSYVYHLRKQSRQKVEAA